MEDTCTYLDGKANNVSKVNDTYSSIRKQPNSSEGDEQLYAVVQKGKPLKPKKTLGKGNNATTVNVAKVSSSDVLGTSQPQTTGFDSGGDEQLYAVVQKGKLLKPNKTVEKGNNDVNDSIAETPSSSVPESNERQTTGFDSVGEGQLYDKLRQGKPQTSKKNVEKRDNHSAGNTAQTLSSRVPPTTKLKTTHDAERKWSKTKLVCATITTLFALAGFCIAVVTLVEITSQAEVKQLTAQINELEELIESASTKIMELEVRAESANASISELEVHAESADTSISELEEALESTSDKTNELEVTIQTNTDDLYNSVQECNTMVKVLANQTAELEETVFKLHTMFIYNGYGYNLTSAEENWSASQESCKKIGGNLAAVGIRDTNALEYIGKELLTQATNVWIGLTDEMTKDHFVWVDGVEYTEANPPWTSGEPNDENHNTNCVEINESLTMNDDYCNKDEIKHHGICEIPLLV